MSTYARLGYSLSDTDSLIPAQAEDRGRTATGLIQASTWRTHGYREYQKTPANDENTKPQIHDRDDPRRHIMSETRIEPLSHNVPSPRRLGSTFRALTLAGATLTTGLAAGVFYAYAVSVNLGLATQPDASYVATMQAINERIENPLFFASFFGGGFLLTVFVNVPLNEQLASVATDASPGELARARAGYEGPWNFWNSVRTMFSFLAFVALVGACLLREDRR